MVYSINNMPYSISLGRQGENNFITLIFDISSWTDRYGTGTAKVIYQNPDGDTREVASGSIEEGVIRWNVSSEDTAIVGTGKAEIRLNTGTVLGKSITFSTSVMSSITEEPTAVSVSGAESGRFIGSFESVEQLNEYSGEIKDNDYAYVNIYSAISSQLIRTDKYIYSDGQWLFAYTVNGGDLS